MIRNFLACTCPLWIAAITSTASADVLTVDDDGPADFSRVQDALDAAMDGDEIVVMPGVYLENLNTLGKAITLRSEDPLDDKIVAATILDGNQSGSVIRCVSGEGAGTFISGLTIQNGIGSAVPIGGGLYGGGMHCFDSYPTIDRCVFVDNTAIAGAGLFVGTSYELQESASMTITRCVFVDNRGFYEGPEEEYVFPSGAGANLANASFTITDCDFIGNSADCGAGLSIITDQDSEIRDCYFEGNVAAMTSGAFGTGLFDGAELDVFGTEFIGNHAGIIGGAAYHSRGRAIRYTDCRFERNTTLGHGGSVCAQTVSKIRFESCEFFENNAGGNGGAVYLADVSSESTFILCEFRSNIATLDGGAIHHTLSWPFLLGCVIAENHAGLRGGGISCETSRADIFNTTIAGNTSKIGGGGIDQRVATTFLSSSIVRGNTPLDLEWLVIEPIVDGSLVPIDFPDSFAVITEDPMFVNPSAGDFRLAFGSPAIDMVGFSGPFDRDILGNPRRLGFSVDIGAYEFAGSPDCPGDCSFDRNVDFEDLTELLFRYGMFTGDACDPDGSGAVDFSDLVAALGLFGPCP